MTQISLLPDEAPAYDEGLAQWFTPPALAERMARRFLSSAIRSTSRHNMAPVLEPTAGSGSLVRAALDVGRDVYALDLDPRWVDYMDRRFELEACSLHERLDPSRTSDSPRVTTIRANFLELEPDPSLPAPIVFMNPPDNAKAGIFLVDFLDKAAELAGPGGDVVALIRLNGLTSLERYERVWSRVALRNVAHLVTRPKFSGAGGGGQQEWCVVRYGLPLPEEGPATCWPEWWTDAWNA